MRKLILFSIVIFIAYFIFTHQNRTIIVEEVLVENNKCFVIDSNDKKYEIPVDTTFSWNFVSNWLILNLDAMEDSKKLQKYKESGNKCYIRTYGLFTPKITAVLESPNERLLILDIFTLVKVSINKAIKASKS